jgi:chromosome segregation ATPase
LSNLKNESINDTNRVDGLLAAKRTVGTDLSQKLNGANSKLARAEKEVEATKGGTPEQIAEAQANLMAAQKEAKTAQDNFDANAATIANLTQERTDLNGSTGKYSHKTANGKVNRAGYNKYKQDVQDKLNKTIAEENANLAKATTQEARDAIQANINAAQKEYAEAQETIRDMEKQGVSKGWEDISDNVESLDNLALRIVPALHHHVEQENAERTNAYAKEIRGRWFNRRANDKAAHDAIMRSEVKKH